MRMTHQGGSIIPDGHSPHTGNVVLVDGRVRPTPGARSSSRRVCA
jgi:hypothetical protein